jgi:hypothetical protein
LWRIERRLDARLRSDARARVMNNTVTKSRPDRAFFFCVLEAKRSRELDAGKDVSALKVPGLDVWGRFDRVFFCFLKPNRDIFIATVRKCDRFIDRRPDRLRVRLTLSSKSPVSVRARADSHSCRARVHTETTMAFSIAASPRLGLERSLRQADGRKVARCVFRGPALGSTSSHKKPYATSY